MSHVRGVTVFAMFALLGSHSVEAQVQPPAQPPKTQAAQQPTPSAGNECALSVTNRSDCVVTIDREHPSSPLPITMQRGKVLTVRVKKRPLDDIKVDATFADIASPDPSAALFAAILPSLGNVVVGASLLASEQQKFLYSIGEADLAKAPDPTRAILEELKRIDAEQKGIGAILESSNTPLDNAKDALKSFRALSHDHWNSSLSQLSPEMQKLRTSLTTAAGSNAVLGEVAGLHEAMTVVTKRYAALFGNPQPMDPIKLRELGVTLNQVAANQALIEGSSASVNAAAASARETAKVVGELMPATTAEAASLIVFQKPFTDEGARGGRSVVVKLKQKDVISTDSADMATVTASWSSTRLSISGGIAFSTTMPSRTFANSAQIVNGVPQKDGDKINTIVTESQTFPQVIPMALTHVLLWEAARYDKRLAAHATVGIGVNPYSKTADFGFGATFSYRALMFSVLERLGRDSRLGGGLQVGQSLGGDPPDLPVENFWKWDHFNIAVTAKIF